MGYNPNIPAAGDDPSVSQGQIQTNFGQINTFVGVNHLPFGDPNVGKHKWVEFINQGGVPPGLIAGEGTLYTQSVAGVSQLFYSPDNSGIGYQISTIVDSIVPNFGTYSAYASGVGGITTTGGWTYFPGGLIFQYGTVTPPGNGSKTVNLPRSFPTSNFVMTISTKRLTTNVDEIYIISKGTSSFNYVTTTSGSGFSSFDFMAIGK